jgi:hypothetical protein
MKRGRYKIATVSRLTGFSPVLLRAWESRHHLLAPSRGPGGQRLYSDDDVAVLRRVRALLEGGSSIGEIAAGGRRALIEPPARLEEPAWRAEGPGAPPARSLHAAARAVACFSARLDRAQVLDVVVQTLAGDFASALARVWVLDATANVLWLRASAGLSTRTTTSPRARIDLSRYRYKVGVVARTRTPFISNDIAGDEEFDQRWVRRERLASVAILPLLHGGELHGVLASFFRVALTEEVGSALAMFATIAASSIAAHDAQADALRLCA